MSSNNNTVGTIGRARGVVDSSQGNETRSPIVFSGLVVHKEIIDALANCDYKYIQDVMQKAVEYKSKFKGKV